MPTMTATATMKAVRIHKFGGPEVLVFDDTSAEEPSEEEILVRVHAAGVNPVIGDFGREAFRERIRLPLILGRDIAGVVQSVGLRVTGFVAGEAVFAFAASHGGGYAEYAVVNGQEAARKPRTLDYAQAAGVPLAATTAWQGLFDYGGLSKGQSVLIYGAAGGVGGFAVQFGKATGARVIGTASADHLDYVRDLGADEVVDYQATRFKMWREAWTLCWTPLAAKRSSVPGKF